MNGPPPPRGASPLVYTREALLAALLAPVFYHPLWQLGSLLAGGDAANLFWPMKVLIQQAVWNDGIVPLWNPYSFMGSPMAASLQHGVFYPLNWLVYTLLPAHAGLMAGNLVHLGLAASGMYFWLRTGLRLAALPAIALGAAFPCTAWFWGHQEHINQIAAISWLPLQALSVWLYVRGQIHSRAFVLSYAGLASLQFLAGHPQEAFYAHLFCGGLAIWQLAARRGRKPFAFTAIRDLTCAAAMTALVVAVQLLMTLELSSHSRRQFSEPGYAVSYSMPPDLLATYIAPHSFGSFREGYYREDEAGQTLTDEAGNPQWDFRAYGEYGLYVGLPVLILAAMAFLGRRRKAATGFLLLAVLALLLAMGGNTDPRRIMSLDFEEQPGPGWSLYELLVLLFPPADGFRVPARIAVLAAFCLCTMAALGMGTLLRLIGNRRARFASGVAVMAAILAALYIPSRKEKFHYPVDAEYLARQAGTEAIQATLDNRLYRLTVSDDQRLMRQRHRKTAMPGGNPLTERFIARQPHMNAVARVPLADGYEEGLLPTLRLKDFLFEFNRNLRQRRPDPALLTLLGIDRIYTDLPMDEDAYPVDRVSPIGWRYHENPKSLGAAFVEQAAKGLDPARLDGPFYRGGEPHEGLRGSAVPIGSLPEWNPDWPRLRTALPTTNRVQVFSDQPGETGDALLAMGWYPGWRFAESMAEVEFLNAVHARLPASQQVEGAAASQSGRLLWDLQFAPFSYRAGLFFSAIGIAFWSGLFAFHRGRRRRIST